MPKREDIVSKFDALEVDEILAVEPEDVAYCERVEKEFFSKKYELENWIIKVTELVPESEQTDLHIWEKSYQYPYKRVSKVWDRNKSGIFDDIKFTNLFTLEWLEKKIYDIEHIYITTIYQYFQGKYNLSLKADIWFFRGGRDADKNDEIVIPISYKELVKDIVEQCGGVGLLELGINRFKESFRSNIKYSDNVKINKNKLTIDDFFYFGGYDGDRWGYSNSKLGSLKDAFGFFEFRTLGSGSYYNDLNLHGEKVQFNFEYEIDGLEKVKSIKVFKNGRVDVKFLDATALNEFFALFELDKLQENTWRRR